MTRVFYQSTSHHTYSSLDEVHKRSIIFKVGFGCLAYCPTDSREALTMGRHICHKERQQKCGKARGIPIRWYGCTCPTEESALCPLLQSRWLESDSDASSPSKRPTWTQHSPAVYQPAIYRC